MGKLLREERPAGETALFGFHQPPFHSVGHLHMHCLVLPFTPSWQAFRFHKLSGAGFLAPLELVHRLRAAA